MRCRLLYFALIAYVAIAILVFTDASASADSLETYARAHPSLALVLTNAGSEIVDWVNKGDGRREISSDTRASSPFAVSPGERRSIRLAKVATYPFVVAVHPGAVTKTSPKGEACGSGATQGQRWYNFRVRYDVPLAYSDISGRVCGQNGLGTWHVVVASYPRKVGIPVSWFACVPVVQRGVPGTGVNGGLISGPAQAIRGVQQSVHILQLTVLNGDPLRLSIGSVGYPYKTVLIGQGLPNEGPLSGIKFGKEIAAAAARHNLDPTLLAAIAAQETGGPSSDSGQNIKGDCTPDCHGYGVFQIDDRSWPDFTGSPQAMNPADNAEFAAVMMEDLLAKYGGDVHTALSDYNAGHKGTRCGTKTFWQANGDTLCYADSVLRHQDRLKSKKVGSCQ